MVDSTVGCVWDPRTEGDDSIWVGAMVRSSSQKTGRKLNLEMLGWEWHLTFENMLCECQVGVLNRPLSKALIQGATLLQDCGAFYGYVKVFPLFLGNMLYKIDRVPPEPAILILLLLWSFGVRSGKWDSMIEGLGSGGFDSELKQWNWRELAILIHMGDPDRWQPSLLFCSTTSLVPAWMTQLTRQIWTLMGMRVRWPYWCLMAGEFGKHKHRYWDCWWQHATNTGHGIRIWDCNMGWGGTASGEIPRCYQISLLRSENHDCVYG